MPKEIIITIPKKRRTAQAPRKGVIRPGRRSEYLARRRKKGGCRIKLFDVAQRWGGSAWIADNPVVAEYTDFSRTAYEQLDNYFIGKTNEWLYSTRPIIRDDFNAVIGMTFGVGAEFYSIADSELFDGERIVLSTEQSQTDVSIAAPFGNSYMGWLWKLNGDPDSSEAIKWTATADATSPMVDMQLSGDIDLFLISATHWYFAQGHAGGGGVSGESITGYRKAVRCPDDPITTPEIASYIVNPAVQTPEERDAAAAAIRVIWPLSLPIGDDIETLIAFGYDELGGEMGAQLLRRGAFGNWIDGYKGELVAIMIKSGVRYYGWRDVRV